MERLYKGFEIIKNHFHTSNQQRSISVPGLHKHIAKIDVSSEELY